MDKTQHPIKEAPEQSIAKEPVEELERERKLAKGSLWQNKSFISTDAAISLKIVDQRELKQHFPITVIKPFLNSLVNGSDSSQTASKLSNSLNNIEILNNYIYKHYREIDSIVRFFRQTHL